MIKLSVIAMLLLTTGAVAHEAPNGWQYDQSCCNTMDCFQEQMSNVIVQKDGYHILPTDEVISYNDKRIRQSKDQYYHRCTRLGNPNQNGLICLYVPLRSM